MSGGPTDHALEFDRPTTLNKGDDMHDLEIRLQDRPGGLAAIGEALAAADISVEGGGVWSVGGVAVAHFLVAEGAAGVRALEAAGLSVRAQDVLLLRLDQQRPGQLGALGRAMADAGVNVAVQYSDHDGRLVLVVDQPEPAAAVARHWPAAEPS